ncbi:hypothetical protein BHM03_00059257, partial [Ensete ventricosum]
GMHCAYRLVPVPYRYRQYVGTPVRTGRRNRLPTILPRGRSVSPREEKESPADDSSPTDDESHGQPAINGRRGELLKYDIRYRMV